MVVNKDTLDEYCERVYNKPVEEIEDNGKIFEALSESIAEEYPETQNLSEIQEDFEESDKDDLKEFFEYRFNQYVDDELFGIISEAHKNKWVKYGVERLRL